MPKPFIYSSTWEKTRDAVLDYLNILIDCKKVWAEVKLEQVIFTLTKNQKSTFYLSGKRTGNEIKEVDQINKNDCKEFGFFLNDIEQKEAEIGKKIHSIKTSLNDFGKNQRGGMFQNQLQTEKTDFPVLGGAEIQRYFTRQTDKFLAEEINDDKAKIKDNSVLVQNLVAHIENPTDHIKIIATIEENKSYFILDTINQIIFDDNFSSKFALLLLNSTLINWYAYRFIFAKAIRTMHFDNSITSKIPVPKISLEAQKPFIEKADLMLKLNQELHEKKEKFLTLIKHEFGLEKIGKKLDKFWQLSFDEFAKALEIKKLSLEKKADLLDFFTKNQTGLSTLATEIQKQDQEIDEMVFELYGLSEEERRIIGK